MVFAGTNEGREICQFLCKHQVNTSACVATEYGSFCLEGITGLEVMEGRLDALEIQDCIEAVDYVVDASHPYAQVISENIRQACRELKALQKKEVPVIRIIRESYENKGIVFSDFETLCDFLNTKEGNILLTTGSKDLHYFQQIKDYETRVFPRVLPAMDSLKNALELGFKPSNILCMQGPFSKEMNIAILEKTKAQYLVSKDTGSSGGFSEKIEAAACTGAQLLTVGRPCEEEGLSLQETKAYFQKVFGLEGEVVNLVSSSTEEPLPSTIDKNKTFPLFVPLEKKQVLVVGAGKVGTRRIRTLLDFGCKIKVVSPEYTEAFETMIEEKELGNLGGKLEVISDHFQEKYLEDVYMVIGTTNHPEINEEIYEACKKRGILVNICDNPKKCDFYFPAIFQTDDIVGGIVSTSGRKHTLVKNTAKKIRGIL